MVLIYRSIATSPGTALVFGSGAVVEPWLEELKPFMALLAHPPMATTISNADRMLLGRLQSNFDELRAGRAVQRREKLKSRILHLYVTNDYRSAGLLLLAGHSSVEVMSLMAELPVPGAQGWGRIFAAAHPGMLAVLVRDTLPKGQSAQAGKSLPWVEILREFPADRRITTIAQLCEQLKRLPNGLPVLDRLIIAGFNQDDCDSEPFFSVLGILQRSQPDLFVEPTNINGGSKTVLTHLPPRVVSKRSKTAESIITGSCKETITALWSRAEILDSLPVGSNARQLLLTIGEQRRERWRVEIFLRELQVACRYSNRGAISRLQGLALPMGLVVQLEGEGSIRVYTADEQIPVVLSYLRSSEEHSSGIARGDEIDELTYIEEPIEVMLQSVRSLLAEGRLDLAADVALDSMPAGSSWRMIMRRLEPREGAQVLAGMRHADLEVYLQELQREQGKNAEELGLAIARICSEFDTTVPAGERLAPFDTFIYGMLVDPGPRRQFGKLLIYNGILSPERQVSAFYTTMLERLVAHRAASGGGEGWYAALKILNCGRICASDTDDFYVRYSGISRLWEPPIATARRALPLLDAENPKDKVRGIKILKAQFPKLEYDDRESLAGVLLTLLESNLDPAVAEAGLECLKGIVLVGEIEERIDAEVTALKNDLAILRWKTDSHDLSMMLVIRPKKISELRAKRLDINNERNAKLCFDHMGIDTKLYQYMDKSIKIQQANITQNIWDRTITNALYGLGVFYLARIIKLTSQHRRLALLTEIYEKLASLAEIEWFDDNRQIIAKAFVEGIPADDHSLLDRWLEYLMTKQGRIINRTLVAILASIQDTDQRLRVLHYIIDTCSQGRYSLGSYEHHDTAYSSVMVHYGYALSDLSPLFNAEPKCIDDEMLLSLSRYALADSKRYFMLPDLMCALSAEKRAELYQEMVGMRRDNYRQFIELLGTPTYLASMGYDGYVHEEGDLQFETFQYSGGKDTRISNYLSEGSAASISYYVIPAASGNDVLLIFPARITELVRIMPSGYTNIEDVTIANLRDQILALDKVLVWYRVNQRQESAEGIASGLPGFDRKKEHIWKPGNEGYLGLGWVELHR